MNNNQKQILHSLALKYGISDSLAKKIVESPYMFMRMVIRQMDLENEEKTIFYHKKLGRFYLNRSIYNKIKNAKNNIK